MATDTEPQHAETNASSGSSDPGARGTASDGLGSAATTQDAPPDSAAAPAPSLWQELGYASADELKAAHSQYGQQMDGARREVEKLRNDHTTTQQQLSQAMQMLSQIQQAAGGRGTNDALPTSGGDIKEFMDAYMNEDKATMNRWWEQNRGLTPAEANQHFLQLMRMVAKPAQFADHLTRDFPGWNDPKGDLYRELYHAYDDYAADPIVSLKYTEDPMTIQEFASPDGLGSRKRMDYRVMSDLLWRLKASGERKAGRQEEHTRANMPTIPDGGQRSTTQQTDNAPLLTADEERFIRENMKALPKEWGATPEAVMKHKWDKLLDANEKSRRRAARAAGTWSR